MKRNKLIIISGATATGKTKLSIDVANMFSVQNIACEIVNFDSLLFYRELNIASAKPSALEMKDITHHLIGNISIQTDYNASKFTMEATPIIKQLFVEEKIPILVGGSAFYLRALLKGMYDGENVNTNINLAKKDNEQLIIYLSERDPESLEAIHRNDHYRLERAANFHLQTGGKLSDKKKEMEKKSPYDFTKNIIFDAKVHHIYLDIPKVQHLNIIQKRTKQMLSNGLVAEIEKILANGATGEEKALTSIGPKETIDYLKNEGISLEDLESNLNISTRQLAKAQRTFFNKIIGKNKYNPLDHNSNLIQELEYFINKK